MRIQIGDGIDARGAEITVNILCMVDGLPGTKNTFFGRLQYPLYTTLAMKKPSVIARGVTCPSWHFGIRDTISFCAKNTGRIPSIT